MKPSDIKARYRTMMAASLNGYTAEVVKASVTITEIDQTFVQRINLIYNIGNKLMSYVARLRNAVDLALDKRYNLAMDNNSELLQNAEQYAEEAKGFLDELK